MLILERGLGAELTCTCMYMHVHIYIYMLEDDLLYLSIEHMYIYKHMLYVHVHTCTYMYMYIYMLGDDLLYLSIEHMYMYIQMLCTYTCTYMYMYIHMLLAYLVVLVLLGDGAPVVLCGSDVVQSALGVGVDKLRPRLPQRVHDEVDEGDLAGKIDSIYRSGIAPSRTYVHKIEYFALSGLSIVEPQNKGHFGTSHLVLC